jgi:hypothetical protein
MLGYSTMTLPMVAAAPDICCNPVIVTPKIARRDSR